MKHLMRRVLCWMGIHHPFVQLPVQYEVWRCKSCGRHDSICL